MQIYKPLSYMALASSLLLSGCATSKNSLEHKVEQKKEEEPEQEKILYNVLRVYIVPFNVFEMVREEINRIRYNHKIKKEEKSRQSTSP